MNSLDSHCTGISEGCRLSEWAHYRRCSGTFSVPWGRSLPATHQLQLLAIHEGAGVLSCYEAIHGLSADNLYLLASTHKTWSFAGKHLKASLFTFSEELINDGAADSITQQSIPTFIACRSCANRTSPLLGSHRVVPKARALIEGFHPLETIDHGRQIELFGKSIELLGLTFSLMQKRGTECKRFVCCKEDLRCIEKATQFIEQHLEHSFSLSEVAQAAGLNEFKLKAGFRSYYGTTVFGYLREKRMEHAYSLFSCGERNVTEVALRVGYSNPSHFATAFRKAYSINPKAYVQALALT